MEQKMSERWLKVTLIKSQNSSPWIQQQTVKGLGLKKIRSYRILPDTPAIRGMVRKVSHLIAVEILK